MHLTDVEITDYLPQRNPMLMIHKILSIDKGWIEVVPSISLNDAPLWALLEAMGQTAQLLWELSEKKGVYYIAKVDKFQRYKEFPDSDMTLFAKKEVILNQLYRAEIKLLSNNVEYASAIMTHFYSNMDLVKTV